MMRVAIRADASSPMGTGHLRRCLALAQALADCGAQVIFVCHPLDGAAATLLKEHPFACAWLPASARPDSAADAATALKAFDPQWVVVDHYDLDSAWHEAIRNRLHCRIAVIDDLANRPLAPDMLVDPNFHEDHCQKYQAVLKPGVKMLAGPRYALLDPVYARSARYQFSERVCSIGIFMGGSDPVDACGTALRACREVAGFAGPIEIVSSRLSPHYELLQQACSALPPTTLSTDLPDLAAFFARHDLQIGAGGGATWERCCVGAPTIACLVASNQLSTLPHLEAQGVLLWAHAGDDLKQSIGEAVTQLLHAPKRRKDMAERSVRMVDGRGAARVAAVLVGSHLCALQVRAATAADAQLLLDWANDPVVRTHAFNPALISPHGHATWLDERLANPDRCRIFIAEAPNGIPVGQVRFERCDEDWEIGYSVDAAFRQTGQAHRLLGSAITALREAVDVKRVLGRVKRDNVASARVFQRLGFDQQEVCDERGTYWLYSLAWPQARQ